MYKQSYRKFWRKKDKLGRPEEVTHVLKRCLQGLGRPENIMLTRLWEHWGMVMGEEISALGSPLGAKNGVLFVGAEDGMSVQDLSYMSCEILERANAFMESEFFKDVKVRLSLDKENLQDVVQKHSVTYTVQRLEIEGEKLSGEYLKDMDKESAVARCYARFIAATNK